MTIVIQILFSDKSVEGAGNTLKLELQSYKLKHMALDTSSMVSVEYQNRQGSDIKQPF